jgi:hypothetical protein
VTELETQLEEEQGEKQNLTSQLSRNKILMTEYPQLSKFSEYIQAGDDEDAYRQNLANFNASLDSFVQTGVDTEVAGASPDVGDTTEEITEGDADSAYNDVVALSGVPGKEKE